MRAIKIQVNFNTGERAGGIDPRDENLQAYGGSKWQKMEGTNNYEIRLVQDDRDLSQYESVDGVTVLRGRQEIEQAIQQLERDKPTQWATDKEAVLADLKYKGEMKKLRGKTIREAAPKLYRDGVAGISKRESHVPRPWSGKK